MTMAMSYSDRHPSSSSPILASSPMMASNSSTSNTSSSNTNSNIKYYHHSSTTPTTNSSNSPWPQEDDDALRQVMATTPGRSWPEISKRAFSNGKHNKQDCMERWRMISKPRATKGPWTTEEDHDLAQLVHELGPEKWVVIASKLGTRTGKQCRERWHNHLDPSISKAAFSPEEDETIFFLYAKWGSKWAEIAKHLPGRPDNMIKNHFNTSLQRQKRRIRQRDMEQQSSVVDSTLPRFVPYARHARPPFSPMLSSPPHPMTSSNRLPSSMSTEAAYDSERFTPPATPDLAHTPSTYGMPSASPRADHVGYFPAMPARSPQTSSVPSFMNATHCYHSPGTPRSPLSHPTPNFHGYPPPATPRSPHQRLPLPPSPPSPYSGLSTALIARTSTSPEADPRYRLLQSDAAPHQHHLLHLPPFPYHDPAPPSPAGQAGGLPPLLQGAAPIDLQQQQPSPTLSSTLSQGLSLHSTHRNHPSPTLPPFTTRSAEQVYAGYTSPPAQSRTGPPFQSHHQQQQHQAWSVIYPSAADATRHAYPQTPPQTQTSQTYTPQPKQRQSLLSGALHHSLPLSPPDSLTPSSSSNGSIRSRAGSLVSPLIAADDRLTGSQSQSHNGLQTQTPVEPIREEDEGQWVQPLPLPLPLPSYVNHMDIESTLHE
ncbi:MAG: hypothetical protein CYPHOPRED_004583 [Cyphobasidiales sp. Tagirdzhanova-0007]|nr:MAG: hypothetical protein CYPHOPRED_004583 [Cyphobasidiales sp. Tagirdzhanova-0007]